MKQKLLIIGSFLALALPTPALASELFGYVSGAIERAERQWAGRHFNRTLSWGVQSVLRGYQSTTQFTASESARITAVAACDTDCTRVRVTIRDFENRSVAATEGSGGVAEVSFYPRRGQTYRLQAEPLDCSTAYCFQVWSIVQ